MGPHERATLPLPQAISFFRAVRDEDSFTVLWELAANSPTPVPLESMRKTFGADPRYLVEVLERLHRLGIARRTGRQWTIAFWAKSTLEYLEELMKDIQIDVAEPASPVVVMYADDAASVATFDGFWMATASQVTGQDETSRTAPTTATANGAAELSSPEQADNPRNEARSHDYK